MPKRRLSQLLALALSLLLHGGMVWTLESWGSRRTSSSFEIELLPVEAELAWVVPPAVSIPPAEEPSPLLVPTPTSAETLSSLPELPSEPEASEPLPSEAKTPTPSPNAKPLDTPSPQPSRVRPPLPVPRPPDSLYVAYLEQVEPCWRHLPGERGVRIRLWVSLREDGTLRRPPQLLEPERLADPTFRSLSETLIAALLACQPYRLAAPYPTWRELGLVFWR